MPISKCIYRYCKLRVCRVEGRKQRKQRDGWQETNTSAVIYRWEFLRRLLWGILLNWARLHWQGRWFNIGKNRKRKARSKNTKQHRNIHLQKWLILVLMCMRCSSAPTRALFVDFAKSNLGECSSMQQKDKQRNTGQHSLMCEAVMFPELTDNIYRRVFPDGGLLCMHIRENWVRVNSNQIGR